MLAEIDSARTHLSSIEDLDLVERFDLVLLLSHLINTPDDAHRAALLNSAVRHVSDDGALLVQRHDPTDEIRPGRTTLGDVGIEISDVDTADWPMVSAVTRYHLGTTTWAQPWTAWVLDDQEIIESLTAVGLPQVTLNGPWVVATRGVG